MNGVLDGHTFSCKPAGARKIQVRLYQVAAPQAGEPYAERAKQALSVILFGFSAYVQIENKGVDKNGIMQGIVSIYQCPKNATCSFPEGSDPFGEINIKMIEQGHARYVPGAGEINSAYQKAEENAKATRLGLWADEVLQKNNTQ